MMCVLLKTVETYYYEKLPDPLVINTLKSLNIQVGVNFLDKYMYKISGMSASDFSLQTLGQISDLLKTIQSLSFSPKVKRKNFLLYVDQKLKSMKIIQKSKIYRSFAKNEAINEFLKTFFYYKKSQEESLTFSLQIIFKHFCFRIIKLYSILLPILSKQKKLYTEDDIFDIESFLRECINILKNFVEDFSRLENKEFAFSDLKKYSIYRAIVAKYIKTIFDIIIQKIKFLELVLRQQEASIFAKFKSMISMFDSTTFKNLQYFIDLFSNVFQLEPIIFKTKIKDYDELVTQAKSIPITNFLQHMQSINFAKNPTYADHQVFIGYLTKSIDSLNKLENVDKIITENMMGFLIMAIINLKLKQQIIQNSIFAQHLGLLLDQM